LTNLPFDATIKPSLEKEVVQKIWIVVKDRGRWPTVEVAPLT
jgi:hypothetical protein